MVFQIREAESRSPELSRARTTFGSNTARIRARSVAMSATCLSNIAMDLPIRSNATRACDRSASNHQQEKPARFSAATAGRYAVGKPQLTIIGWLRVRKAETRRPQSEVANQSSQIA